MARPPESSSMLAMAPAVMVGRGGRRDTRADEGALRVQRYDGEGDVEVAVKALRIGHPDQVEADLVGDPRLIRRCLKIARQKTDPEL
jgi:hypothetical protein